MKKVFLTFGLVATLIVACNKSDNSQPQSGNEEKPVVAEEFVFPKKMVRKKNGTITGVVTATINAGKAVSNSYQEYENGKVVFFGTTTMKYQGDFLMEKTSTGKGTNYITNYTYENGKLVKKERQGEINWTKTFTYDGDKLSKKIHTDSYDNGNGSIDYTEYTYTYNGDIVTEAIESYTRVNGGNKEDVDTKTNTYTIQNGNLIKVELNLGEKTIISEYTYGTNKNFNRVNFLLAANPDHYFVSNDVTLPVNNILTEIHSEKDNTTGVVTIKEKTTNTYVYNDKGYPTKITSTITDEENGSTEIRVEEYEY